MTAAADLAVTQAEFARQCGWAKSYVTALKAAGRLVMDESGRVLVEASLRRIDETKDPNRADVAARHAAARSRAGAPEAPAPQPEAPTPNPEAPTGQRDAREDRVGQSYQQSKAVKELYLARMAKLDYERAAGQMVERAAVEGAVEDVLVTLRQALDQIPHRLAPVLVGQDIDAIRRQLRTEIDSVRTALVANFKVGLRELAGESVEPTINL